MNEIIATLATELVGSAITPEAIRKWRERGKVPHRHRLPLIDLARRKRLRLTADDFDFTPDKTAPKKRRAA